MSFIREVPKVKGDLKKNQNKTHTLNHPQAFQEFAFLLKICIRQIFMCVCVYDERVISISSVLRVGTH